MIKEFLCEVASKIVEAKFGENTYIEQDNGDFIFTDEAQDEFNSVYDEIETLYAMSCTKVVSPSEEQSFRACNAHQERFED